MTVPSGIGVFFCGASVGGPSAIHVDGPVKLLPLRGGIKHSFCRRHQGTHDVGEASGSHGDEAGACSPDPVGNRRALLYCHAVQVRNLKWQSWRRGFVGGALP